MDGGVADTQQQSAARGWLPWAVGGGVLLAIGGLAGVLAANPDDPHAGANNAIAEVKAGQLDSGCATLSHSLRDNWLLEQQLDGARAAIERCVERDIQAALAQTTPTAKEQALLAIVASDAGLTPSDEQFERVDREVAAIPGAIEEGKPRFRFISYEVEGPLDVAVLRKHSQGQLLRLRGCHANALRTGAKLEEELTVTLRVGADGVVSKTHVEPSPPAFAACLKRSFLNAELGALSDPSRVTIKAKQRSFQ
jgi:hypothetical protein